MALAFVPFGSTVTVIGIRADERMKHHLESLGLVVGASLRSLSVDSGNMIVEVKGCRLALSKGLAMKIMVAA